MTRPYKKRVQSPERLEIVAAMREQVEFERKQREARIARIVEVATKNPTVSASDLAERFNVSEEVMRHFLARRGLSRARWIEDVKRDEARALPGADFDLGWHKRGAA